MSADKKKGMDEFIKKIVTEAGTEKPSVNFTDSVMSKIQELKEESISIRYVPLISKNAWFLIAVILFAVCAILLNTNWQTEVGILSIPYAEYLSNLNFGDVFNKLRLNRMDNINIHKNFVYAMLILSVFLYAQIFLHQRRAN